MTTPRHTLRAVFATSLLTSAFWLIGIAWEFAFGKDAPIPLLVFLAAAVAMMACWPAFNNAGLLVPGSTRPIGLARLLLSRLILCYFALVPVCGVAAWVLVQLFAHQPSHPETRLFIWLFALWFPLWLAPAIAAVLAWRALLRSGAT